MQVYIIGTVEDNSGSRVGYVLTDIENNFKTMTIKKQSLIRAMKNNSISIKNAKLIKDNNGHLTVKISSPVSKIYTDKSKNSITSGKREVLMLTPVLGVELEKQTETAMKHKFDMVELSKCLNNQWNCVILNKDEVLQWLEKMNKVKVAVDNTNALQKLERDANDPNIVWTIPEFENYMQAHKWAYKIEKDSLFKDSGYTLKEVDCQCKVLHIPDGIIYFDGFKSNPGHLETVIIPASVLDVHKLMDKSTDSQDSISINNFYIQPREEELMSNDDLLKLNIKNLTLSERETKYYKMFNNCNIENIINADKIISIVGCFNDTVIKNGLAEITVSERVQGSFNRTSGIQRIIIKPNVFEYLPIEYSFCDSENLTEIKGEDGSEKCHVIAIDESFCKCNELRSVDFLNADGVCFNRSFNNCANLTNASFNKLEDGYSKRMSRIMQSRNVIAFDNGEQDPNANRRVAFASFAGSPLKELYIGDLEFEQPRYGVEYSRFLIDGFGKDTTIRFGKKFKIIRGIMICPDHNNEMPNVCLDAQEIILGDLLSYLDICGVTHDGPVSTVPNTKYADRVVDIDTIGLFVRVREVDTIDTGDFPNWHSAKMDSLNLYAKTLVINTNLTNISDKAIKMHSVKNLVIDDSNIEVPLKKQMFRTKSSVTVYVIKGSKAAKQFNQWKNDFIVVEVGSVQEALEIINCGDDSKSKLKLRMLLSGSDDNWLLDDTITNGNGMFLYKLLTKMRMAETAPELELDTSKFKKCELFSFDRLTGMFEGVYVNTGITPYKLFNEMQSNVKLSDGYKHNNRFVTLSNLFTKFKASTVMYNEKLWKAIMNNTILTDVGDIMVDVIYTDESKDAIYQLVLGSKKVEFMSALVIEVAGEVQFIADIDLNIFYNAFQSSLRYFALCAKRQRLANATTLGKMKYTNNQYATSVLNRAKEDKRIDYSFADIMQPGDTIYTYRNSECSIGGVSIPDTHDFVSDYNISKIMRENLIVIGYQDKNTDKNAAKLPILFYDTISGKLIQTVVDQNSIYAFRTSTGFNDSIDSRLKDFVSVKVQSVHDLSELDSMNKKYFKPYASCDTKQLNEKLYKEWFMSDDEKQKIYSDMSNYDIGENKYMLNAISLVNNLKYDMLPGTVDDVVGLIKCGILEQTKEYSFADLTSKKGFYEVRSYDLKSDDNSIIKYIEFEKGSYYFSNIGISVVAEKVSAKRFSRVCLKSAVKLTHIYNALKEINEYRQNGITEEPIDRVSDTIYNEDRFVKVYRRQHTYKMPMVEIAIDKVSCNIFITISTADNKGSIPIFRCKTLCGAREVIEKVMFGDIAERGCRILLEELTGTSDTNSHDYTPLSIEKKMNNLLSIRQSIIDGFPNNMPADEITSNTVYADILQLLSKQPKT